MADEQCDSCGEEGVDVGSVRRLYVTPEAWDTPGRIEVAGDERWCYVCRTHYPHHELDATGQVVDHDLGWPTEPPTS